jgi:hypothetical protein
MVSTTRTITINGTTNQVVSSAGGQDLSSNRTWTLSLPQNIHTAATPTFGGLTLSGAQSITGGGLTIRTAATQDGVIIAGRAGGTGDFDVTISPTTLTADRTLTLADGNTTLVGGTMLTTARSISTTGGITGGGDLSADRTFTIADGALTNAKLANSTISGISLGSNLATLTIGTGLSGTSYNGSTAVTIANTGVTSLTGTASQITVSAATGGVTLSLPSTINVDTTGVATTALSMRSQDTRAVVTTPETANASSGVRFDFKTNTTNGLSDGGTYNGVMYFRKYGSTTDWSGGGANELGFTDNGNMWLRYGSSTTWGAWKQMVDSANTLTISGTKTFSTTPVFSEATATLSFSSATGAKTISTGGSTDLFLSPGGNVRIGTAGTAVAAKLQVGGDIRATGEVVAYAASDKNLKDNIQKIESPLEIISKIGGYTFDWNKNQQTYTGKDYGVIAQEIEEVMPELVITRESGYKAVNYEKIIPLLIESIKEQQNAIVAQQTEIKELREVINNILNK